MVDEVTGRFLDAVDEALPGFVTGLYVVGSAALGAWQPGQSDVDTVAFTSRAADEGDVAALGGVHEPLFDTVYVSPNDLWAADQRVIPFVEDGALVADEPCGNLNPVLWLILERYGIPVRGPAVGELGVRVDAGELRAYNLENLRRYWQGLAARIPRVDSDFPVDADYVVHMALGPARLHYTLATGDVVSKSKAGEYAASLFPEHASLTERAIRRRAGEQIGFTATDLAAAASLADLIADDAWARWA